MADKKYAYVRKTRMIDGKQYQVYGRTEKEAQQKLDALIVELTNNGRKLDGTTKVRKWAAEWLEVYVNPRDATPKSLEMYQQKLDNYILPAVGDMRIKDVRDIHLQKMLNAANTSKSTAEKVRIVTQALFRQARKSGLIAIDPAEDLKTPKAPEGKRHSIAENERKNILEVAEYHHGGLYVLILLYCGLRPNEIMTLQWVDIDTSAATPVIHVTKAAESGSGDIKTPKTGAGIRDVPIPAPLLGKLEAQRKAPFDYVLLQPKGKKRHTEESIRCLWNNFKRTLDIHMGAKVYRNQIVKHCYDVNPLLEQKSDWDALTPYSLRHTYGTDLQRAGVPINVAKYLMGHSDISVTANVYTDTTPDVITDSLTKINALAVATD